MTERDVHIGFSAFSGIGPVRFKLLLDYFGSALTAWKASRELLIKIGLGQKLTDAFVDFRSSFSSEVYSKTISEQHIRIVTRTDTDFPTALLEIPDPPIALYVKGVLPRDKKLIGVVGTRKPTTYGKDITEKLVRELSLSGFVIVSGLARGVDGIAHRVALECEGDTIAVLGCGVDIIYPPDHKELYTDILNHGGGIISEVPPGHTVLKGLFPARNRIISGISLGIVVTEGAEDSGSLITARYAAEQGREVFAVPGPITSYLSVGPAKLIKNGAQIITSVQDILEEFDMKGTRDLAQNKNRIEELKNTLTTEQFLIVTVVSQGEIHYDEIVRTTHLSTGTVGSILSLLELSGIIQSLGNGKYTLK